MKRSISYLLMLLMVVSMTPPSAKSKADDFKAVVKFIEQFYRVKHQGIPFLARAGIKTARTAARLAGGSKRKIVEAGSVRVAFFEDQDFSTGRGTGAFRTSLNGMMTANWTPLVQVVSPKDRRHSYIFLRDAGDKFSVLVVAIETREAWVVQADLAPATLAALLQDPDEMGNAIADDAMANDEQE